MGMTWGDKMTKAEIDDIFGEFEIDEDYMIKSKDVIGLFVAVKEERRRKKHHHQLRRLPLQRRTRERLRRRRRRRRRPPSKWLFQYLNEASWNPNLPSSQPFVWESDWILMLTSARLSLHS